MVRHHLAKRDPLSTRPVLAVRSGQNDSTFCPSQHDIEQSFNISLLRFLVARRPLADVGPDNPVNLQILNPGIRLAGAGKFLSKADRNYPVPLQALSGKDRNELDSVCL